MKLVVLRQFARATAALAAVAVLLTVGGTTATADVTVTAVPGTPEKGAAGLAAFGFDFARLGYDVSEFFIEGTADSYHNVEPLTNSAEWVVEPDGAPQAFKTRIQVFTPADPGDFNGTVYVEWFNVSALSDNAPDWAFGKVEMKRQGAIYVGVSAQLVGVNDLKTNFSARYGSLVHPGDSYSYDIFRQVGAALRDHAATIFGAQVAPQRLIADGESQSAGRMITYVNAFADGDAFDGYLIHSRGGAGAALRQSPLGAIAAPSPVTLITEADEPVFTFQSETDSRLPRQDDSATFRWWEVGGTAHADAYLTATVAAVDYGSDPSAAQEYFDLMIHTFTGPTSVGSCLLGMNAGPQVYVFNAALRHLNTWVTDGTLPPIGPRMVTTDGTGAGALVLDAHGNATGGIRSPHLDAPIATLRGTGNVNAAPPPPPLPPTLNFCVLFGTTFPFSDQKLAGLYKKHGHFTAKWNQAVDAAVAGGFMTPEDGEFVKASAATSDIRQ